MKMSTSQALVGYEECWPVVRAQEEARRLGDLKKEICVDKQ